MATMVWKDEYSVGNDLLDEQHKQLIEAVNELNSGAALGEVLAALRQYGDEHFRTEEGMLEASNYPDLERHRSYHEAFRIWLEDIEKNHRSGGDSAMSRRDIYNYLCVWMANHILVYDKAFETWLK